MPTSTPTPGGQSVFFLRLRLWFMLLTPREGVNAIALTCILGWGPAQNQ